jgi:hypothetical protein
MGSNRDRLGWDELSPLNIGMTGEAPALSKWVI